MKKITISDANKTYTLEYTRDSVMKTEQMGFIASKADENPVTMSMLLVRGAFIAHHSDLAYEEIDRLLDSLKNKSNLIARLADMYNDAAQTLVADGEQGNAEWNASW